jgi:UDP-N-acetylmuramoyl-tripeptide--D-alanyl-D-alanine ligase
MHNVARAKAELIKALPPGGVAVVPGDEPLLEEYLGRSDIVVDRVDSRAALPFTTSYSARHQLENTRIAVAVAKHLDVPLPSVLSVEFSELREEERPLPGGGLLLNDCYNANPVSMRAALEHLVARAEGHRRVAVLGEMAELGTEAPAYHREIGELVHRLGIEQVIAVGDLARAYGGDWVPSAADAATKLRAALRPGDVVLVKGSRAVGLEAVAENLSP